MQNPRSASASAPAIVFTGERVDHSFRDLVYGEATDLPSSSFALLIRLVLARADDGTGHIPCGPTPIWRLRKALRKTIGRSRANALIESGPRKEYRLGIPRAELKKQIGVTRAFFELVDLGVVTKKDAARLRRIGHPIKKVEIEKRSVGDRSVIERESEIDPSIPLTFLGESPILIFNLGWSKWSANLWTFSLPVSWAPFSSSPRR